MRQYNFIMKFQVIAEKTTCCIQKSHSLVNTDTTVSQMSALWTQMEYKRCI